MEEMQSRRKRAETLCPIVNDVSQCPRVKNTIWSKPVWLYEHLHKKTSLYSLPSWLCCGSYSEHFRKKMTLFCASKQVKRQAPTARICVSAGPQNDSFLWGREQNANP